MCRRSGRSVRLPSVGHGFLQPAQYADKKPYQVVARRDSDHTELVPVLRILYDAKGLG